MDMVRGLNGDDWDDGNQNKDKQEQIKDNKELQQDNMKQVVEKVIQEDQKNEQFKEKQ